MANNLLDVFNIPTPESVAQQEREETAKGLASADPRARRAASRGAAVRALFGSSAVDAAKAREAQIGTALKNADADLDSRGIEDQAQRQMIRLDAVRQAVEADDPSLGLRIEDQIRELRVMDLERQKLKQQVTAGDLQTAQLTKRFVLNPDTLESEEIDITTSEGLAKLRQAREEGRAVADTEGALLNIFNAERARQFTREQKELDRVAKAQEELLTKENVWEITKTRRTQLQASMTANRQLMDKYQEAAKIMNDTSVLDVMSRVGKFTTKVQDLAGLGLSKAQREQYLAASQAIANLQGAANDLLREQSGAAVTDQEWQRAKVALPNMEDSPQEAMAKMETMFKVLNRSQKRMSRAMGANDFRILDIEGADFAGDEDWLWGEQRFGKKEESAAPAAQPQQQQAAPLWQSQDGSIIIN